MKRRISGILYKQLLRASIEVQNRQKCIFENLTTNRKFERQKTVGDNIYFHNDQNNSMGNIFCFI